uniref:Uncharacterized protein n=1 Tax=Anguilla anguilla TaxID=7936 RepID=A0A0E9PXK7_ANGAN
MASTTEKNKATKFELTKYVLHSIKL